MSDKRRRLATWLRGEGIEIGALHRPLEIPTDATVRYVDFFPTKVLKERHPELGDVPFAPVSVIGDAEDLSAFGNGELDFVIANHLIEHLEDPTTGLEEWHRVLRPGGVLYMAVPDSRVTFDRAREPTPTPHLLSEHRHGTEATRRDHYMDWVLNAEPQPELAALAGEVDDVAARVDLMVRTRNNIHFHVWRSDTFLDFLIASCRENQLDFQLIAFAACEEGCDDEFIVVLMKGAVRASPPPLIPWGSALPGAETVPSFRQYVARGRLGPWLRPIYRASRRFVSRP